MKLHRFLVLFFLTLVPVLLNAQIQVRVHQPPPNQLLIEHLWWVDLTNTSTQTFTVYLYAEIIEAQKGLLFSTNTNSFQLPTGITRIRPSDITDIHDTWYSTEYKNIIMRTGSLPEGDYTVCVYVRHAQTNQELGFQCINQRVYHPGALNLISPFDNAIVKENNPTFTWAQPVPLPPNTRVTYDLKIVEVLEGQTKEEALRSNIPWFERSGIAGTVFRYPIDARSLDPAREYTWQVEAILEGGFPIVLSEGWTFSRTEIHFTPVLERLFPLKVTREVVRHGNWYEVKLELTNMTSENMTNIVVIDSNVGVQCIDSATAQHKTSGQYIILAAPVASEVQNSSSGRSSSIRIELRTSDWLNLAPDRTIIVRYSVVPALYHTSGPYYIIVDRLIGKQLRITYKKGEDQEATERPGLAEDISNDIDQAFGSADYLIATSPSLLFANNPGSEDDVNKLLSGMARLAKAKNGVLGYTSALTHTAFRTLIAPGGNWSNKLIQGWTQSGYLLVVGEGYIIPHWPTVTHAADRPIDMSDYYYSHITGDWRPELCTGRIIGASAHDLLIPIEHSLAVHYNLGAENDGSQAFLATGVEQIRDNFTPAGEEGAEYLRNSKAMVAYTFGQEFITIRETVLRKALRHTPVENGGAHTDSSLDAYTLNQVAAWMREITMGKAAFDAQYPYNLGDQYFTDYEGRLHRVPVNFGNNDIGAAVQSAEVIENNRRQGYEKAYFYAGDQTAAVNLIRNRFADQLPKHDITLFSSHGEFNLFNELNASAVFGMDFTSQGIRPIIISLACWNGEYQRNGHSGIARAFLRQGIAVFIAYTEMTSTGWWLTEVGSPHNLLQYWYKQKRIGLIIRDWKTQLAEATGGYCTGTDSNCRMLFGVNLYGDPKFGGN